ncbi:PREDICTED: 39S ribosomal protein L52, mitochondrial [Acromyrmex echinatior]|uniref:Large ribosomal subunit protein mL52 n=1 Tax=Acromyrmex echinatior TaxID=103372 RepID=F4WW92_ACREC|nr:PREDICTED: 39S ribosomal protein L52, mitochondrial [Acromyrmex echinatior]EGI61563.1 39S ribosomal protein L52, mitochondrial [Acromyrmex echinatior]
MISTARAVLHVERHISYNIVVNGFHQSCIQYINQRWRQKRGLTANPNTFGPLTNLPDYTFKDGRPTPLGIRQKARLDKQRDYAAKIIKLVGEVDFAVERHTRMQEKEKEKRQTILNNKLKPKGDLLLQIQADTIEK